MNCPYFRESYFGICVAPRSVHVPSIDEMERLCFRSSYINCPNISSDKASGGAGNPDTTDDACKSYLDQIARSLFDYREGGEIHRSHL